MTRRWLSLVATVGVLVHAYALVRHTVSMLAHTLSPAAAASRTVDDALLAWTSAGLAAAAFELCLSSEPASPGSSGGAGSDCPLCHGAPANAVPPPVMAMATLPELSTAVAIPRDERSDRHTVIRPPARGPPALA